MKKICVIGGPSSGKTTEALLLAVCLKLMGYEVSFVLEYATNYIMRNGDPENVFEQFAIFQGQKDEEGYVEKFNRRKGGIDFLVTDCASFLAAVYCRSYQPKPNASKEKWQKYNFALKTLDKWSRERVFALYDYVFFLPSEIPFKKNSIRWQADKKEAEKIADQIESYLKIECRRYHRITGSLMERTLKILEILGVFPSEEIKGILEILGKILRETEEKNLKIFPLIE